MKNLSAKKVFLSVLLFNLLVWTPAVQAEMLFRMHGSNTVGAELGPALVKQYMQVVLGAKNIKYQPGARSQEGRVVGELTTGRIEVEIHAHGSSTSFRDILSASADLGMSSRPIKDKEVKKLKKLADFSSHEAEHVVGLDGIAVVVPKSNKTASLSLEQLAGIFSGKIQYWKRLGKAGGRINVYARDDNSGTYDTFKSLVLGKKAKLVASAKRYESNADLSDAVARDPGGIGFVGLPYIRDSRAVNISAGKGKARFPSVFNVATEDYALSRRLYMYADPKQKNKHVHRFLEYVASPQGQALAAKIGFVSQNLIAVNSKVSDVYPEEYLDFVKGAKRLSVNFRFRKDSLELDSRAQRDLERLAHYVKANPQNSELMLFGFSEDSVMPMYNIALSESRADMVEYELRKRGVTVNRIRGYGAYEAVAENSEKTKNRRVEVWVR